MQCQTCNVEMIARETSSNVSGAGLFGALIAVIGLVTLLFNALLGVGIIIIGLLLGGLTRKKRLFLVCPSCRRQLPVA